MISVLWIPALILAGMYVGVEFGRRQAPLIQPPPLRLRRQRDEEPAGVGLDDETAQWLRTMHEEHTDSLELRTYRYKWKKKLLAIEAGAQRLMLTAKPHSSYEMARIAKYMKTRKRPVTEGKVLSARRRQ